MKVTFGICLVLAARASAAVLNFREQEAIHTEYLQGRIINGVTARSGQAPYIVLFDDGTQYCAGSIIHPNWVLTAAHCYPESKQFDVVAGLHSRYEKSKAQIRTLNVSNFIGHKEYNVDIAPNDIGLIYVSPSFVLDPNGEHPVDKISLPSGNYSETGKGKVYGWGRFLNGSYPMDLQFKDVDIIGYDECKKSFERKYSNAPLDVSNICTYTEGDLKAINYNDSGGPLVIYTPAGPELVGIVSWSTTEVESMPSVFTMVSAFKDWITETIANFTLPKIV